MELTEFQRNHILSLVVVKIDNWSRTILDYCIPLFFIFVLNVRCFLYNLYFFPNKFIIYKFSMTFHFLLFPLV